MHPMHSADLQAAVTNARDFEAAKLKANHAQAVNLVINKSFELDFKLKQFSDFINQKLEGYLADNHAIYQPPQQYNNQRNVNYFQNQSHPSFSTNQQWQQKMHVCHYCGKQRHLRIDSNILTTRISIFSLLTTATSNISTTTATNNLSDIHSSNTTIQPSSNDIRKPQIKNYPKLEIGNSCAPTNLQFIQPAVRIMTVEFKNWVYSKPKFLKLFKSPGYSEDAQFNNLETNQQPTLTSNILLATITKNKSLDAIFSFKLKELSTMSLFNGAALEKKSITAIYTDVKVDGHLIKLILDNGSAGSIITRQLMDQLGR
ncbi:hypothetical protein G9A89_017837 [Geosiphon pyriformis]|nr:hypothetical protein G9A89_017837 [Geosiphon pyriformis]